MWTVQAKTHVSRFEFFKILKVRQTVIGEKRYLELVLCRVCLLWKIQKFKKVAFSSKFLIKSFMYFVQLSAFGRCKICPVYKLFEIYWFFDNQKLRPIDRIYGFGLTHSFNTTSTTWFITQIRCCKRISMMSISQHHHHRLIAASVADTYTCTGRRRWRRRKITTKTHRKKKEKWVLAVPLCRRYITCTRRKRRRKRRTTGRRRRSELQIQQEEKGESEPPSPSPVAALLCGV